MISSELGADSGELLCKAYKKGFIGFIRGGRDTVTGRCAPVGPLQYDPGVYDLVVAGSPVWVGKLSPPVTAFLEGNKSKIKNLALFITRGDPKNSYKTVFDQAEKVSGLKLKAAFSASDEDVKEGRIALSRFIEDLRR